jgi:hypothetical protein
MAVDPRRASGSAQTSFTIAVFALGLTIAVLIVVALLSLGAVHGN